ncbi:MAG: hypothetical protein KatS3mg021_1317 [Fimbriimonadales bacterium]|nr:MAG: hypothetical protein KatS3mg021_1317 [Fimbriimonadales bacterium]
MAGGLLLLTIVAVFYYLFAESQYAFQRKFPFGFRIALQPPDSEYRNEVSMDPTASLLATHREGTDELDDAEDATRLPSHEELSQMQALVTASRSDRRPTPAAP